MSLYNLIDLIFEALYLALLVRVLLSWIPHNGQHPVVEFLEKITDPMLKPFQNIVPAHKIGFDISPIFAFLALSILKQIIFKII
jgi:YggT family protein